MTARKYRKRPDEVWASVLHKDVQNEISDWITEPHRFTESGIFIEGSNGDMFGSWGDYVIKHNGSFYPCRREIFRTIYQVETEEE